MSELNVLKNAGPWSSIQHGGTRPLFFGLYFFYPAYGLTKFWNTLRWVGMVLDDLVFGGTRPLFYGNQTLGFW